MKVSDFIVRLQSSNASSKARNAAQLVVSTLNTQEEENPVDIVEVDEGVFDEVCNIIGEKPTVCSEIKFVRIYDNDEYGLVDLQVKADLLKTMFKGLQWS